MFRPTVMIIGALLWSGALIPALRCEPADSVPDIIDPGAVTDPFSGVNVEDRDRKTWEAFQKTLGDLPRTDPRQAAEKYRAFFGEHGGLSPSVGVEAAGILAKLYSGPLKSNQQAIAMYDWAIKKFGAFQGASSLIAEKAALLMADHHPEEAEKLYAEHLDQILHGWPQNANDPMDQYSQMLLDAGKTDEMVKLLGQFLVAQPSYLDPGPSNWDWVYDRVANSLLKQGKPKEALGWAKMRFIASAYDPGSIDRASRVLARVWKAADPTGAGLDAFAAAEKDTAAHNPLADVKLPTLDAAALKQRLEWTQGPDRVGAYLLSGDLWGAMDAARSMQAKKDTAREGALQVCRVFKAGDLNLKRASAYLQYLKTGQGDNPVDAFLKEHAKPAEEVKP